MATINLKYNQLVVVGLPEETQTSTTTSTGTVTYPENDTISKLPPYYCNHNQSGDSGEEENPKPEEEPKNIRPVLARVKAFNNTSYTVSTLIYSANLVTCVNPVKEELKEVNVEDLYVLNLDNREVSYKYANGSTVKLHINDLIYVYPYSDKYMILSFNSDNTKALVIRYSECINANKLNTNEMLIIDLTCDKAIPPTEDNGGIPYTYKEESVEP